MQRGRKSRVPQSGKPQEKLLKRKGPRSGRSPGPSSSVGFSGRTDFLWEQQEFLQQQAEGAEAGLHRDKK